MRYLMNAPRGKPRGITGNIDDHPHPSLSPQGRGWRKPRSKLRGIISLNDSKNGFPLRTATSILFLIAISVCTSAFAADKAPPAKGQLFSDPQFGGKLVRMTDKAVDGYSGQGIENEYARSDPENSDGTLVILRGNDGEWYLYNAASFKLIKHLSGINNGGQEPEPRWDAKDPKKFYFLSGMKLKSYNTDTGASAVVHDFSGVDPKAATITTKTEGDASLDRRFWCFMLEDSNYKLKSVIAYDMQTNAVLGQKPAGTFPDDINWVSMDMSGKHCVIGYEDSDTDKDEITPPVDVFSRDMSTKVATLPKGSNGHMDLALTADKRDVMVYQNNSTDWVAMADLETGKETNLIEIPFSTNPDIGLHVSGNCAGKPGWVLISTYGSKNPPEGKGHSWMDNMLFMLELKAKPAVRKLAATNAYTSINFDGDKNYFAEAFAAINTKGTKIYFGSNWGDCSKNEYSETYVLTAP